MKAIMFNEETLGTVFDEVDIPVDLLPLAQKYRTEMLEAVSDIDDTLLEKYLEGKEISETEVKKILREATIQGKIIPVLCGSSFKNKGVQQLLLLISFLLLRM
jgi:elongation factor G